MVVEQFEAVGVRPACRNGWPGRGSAGFGVVLEQVGAVGVRPACCNGWPGRGFAGFGVVVEQFGAGRGQAWLLQWAAGARCCRVWGGRGAVWSRRGGRQFGVIRRGRCCGSPDACGFPTRGVASACPPLSKLIEQNFDLKLFIRKQSV